MILTCADILERSGAFVLDALPPEEAAAVRAHLASCPEAHHEIASLGGVVPYLADLIEPVEPSPELRVRLLAAARATTQSTQPRAAVTGSGLADRAEEPRSKPLLLRSDSDSGTRERPQATAWPVWAMRAAAVIAIVALAGWNVTLQAQLSGARADLASVQAYQRSVSTVLALAVRAGSSTVLLSSDLASAGPSGIASVGSDGSIILAMQGLTATTDSQVYEAWVIGRSGVPIPLGGFVVDSTGTSQFEARSEIAGLGAVLALTLEPRAGATAPTLPIIVKGVVTASG